LKNTDKYLTMESIRQAKRWGHHQLLYNN